MTAAGHAPSIPQAPSRPTPSPARPPSFLRPHTLVASIAVPDAQTAAAALRALPKDVGLAEVRLDFLWPAVPDADRATDDLVALLDAATTPLLATLRPRRQGGLFVGPEDVRVGLLQAALRAGFAAADLELEGIDPGAVVRELRKDGGVVLSTHVAGEAPCRSDGLQALLAMQDLDAAFDKYAFTASAFPDLLRALEFVHTHHVRGGRPAVSTLQHGGAPLRAIAALAGNRATYGHAPGAPPAVPGQPGVADVQALWRHWGLTPDDLDACAGGPGRWYAVLGMPALHSLSPAIHNPWLRAAGRPERFGALEVPASASALRLLFHAAPRIGLAGASITSPHKRDAARASQPDVAAQAIGAVNCVRFEADGTVPGTNTDASALGRLAHPHVGAGSTALVLGAGGFARAAVHALASLGAAVTVAARDPSKAAPLAALGATVVEWPARSVARPDAIIQATTLGQEQAARSPLPATTLAHAPWVLEANYAAGPTGLQQDAQRAGCHVTDGQSLLREQARDAFRFWTGRDVPQPEPR